MASTIEFVNYVCERIAGAGDITYKKMFGEYGIYCDGKIIGLVCDNQFFVKKTEQGAHLLIDAQEATPPSSAIKQPYYVIDKLDDSSLLIDFIRITCDALPPPKPRRRPPFTP